MLIELFPLFDIWNRAISLLKLGDNNRFRMCKWIQNKKSRQIQANAMILHWILTEYSQHTEDHELNKRAKYQMVYDDLCGYTKSDKNADISMCKLRKYLYLDPGPIENSLCDDILSNFRSGCYRLYSNYWKAIEDAGDKADIIFCYDGSKVFKILLIIMYIACKLCMVILSMYYLW